MGRTGLFTLIFSLAAFSAVADIPECLMKKGQVLPINNAQVLEWKNQTANQFHSRGHIKGILTQTYSEKTNHHHWQVQIGDTEKDTIEVIYNEDFGSVDRFTIGSQIEACGDYITSNKKGNGFPASPDGALVHWVHMSPNPNHLPGYLVVDGQLHGQEYNE